MTTEPGKARPTSIGTRDFGAQGVWMAGEGDHEGLYAWTDFTDWGDVSGVIFPAPPPAMPTPPEAASGA